jgi:hypothetical protein
LIFTIETSTILKNKSNVREKLRLYSEKILHIGSYRIKVEMSVFLDFWMAALALYLCYLHPHAFPDMAATFLMGFEMMLLLNTPL